MPMFKFKTHAAIRTAHFMGAAAVGARIYVPKRLRKKQRLSQAIFLTTILAFKCVDTDTVS